MGRGSTTSPVCGSSSPESGVRRTHTPPMRPCCTDMRISSPSTGAPRQLRRQRNHVRLLLPTGLTAVSSAGSMPANRAMSSTSESACTAHTPGAHRNRGSPVRWSQRAAQPGPQAARNARQRGVLACRSAETRSRRRCGAGAPTGKSSGMVEDTLDCQGVNPTKKSHASMQPPGAPTVCHTACCRRNTTDRPPCSCRIAYILAPPNHDAVNMDAVSEPSPSCCTMHRSHSRIS